MIIKRVSEQFYILHCMNMYLFNLNKYITGEPEFDENQAEPLLKK